MRGKNYSLTTTRQPMMPTWQECASPTSLSTRSTTRASKLNLALTKMGVLRQQERHPARRRTKRRRRPRSRPRLLASTFNTNSQRSISTKLCWAPSPWSSSTLTRAWETTWLTKTIARLYGYSWMSRKCRKMSLLTSCLTVSMTSETSTYSKTHKAPSLWSSTLLNLTQYRHKLSMRWSLFCLSPKYLRKLDSRMLSSIRMPSNSSHITD